MSFVRSRVPQGVGIALLTLLIAFGLYLWLRPVAPPSPRPVVTAVVSPTPEAEVTATPNVTGTATPEIAVLVHPTPELVATSVPCWEGICVLRLDLPPPWGIPIAFIDESPTYDWTTPSVACLAALGSFMSQEKMVWSDITFTLQDELDNAGTPVEFQHPPSVDPVHNPAPDAVKAQCTVAPADQSQVACQIQVQSAAELPNPNIEIALMAAALDGLRRIHHEEFVQDLEPFYHYGALERFVPILQSQGEAWRSQCLQVFGVAPADVP